MHSIILIGFNCLKTTWSIIEGVCIAMQGGFYVYPLKQRLIIFGLYNPIFFKFSNTPLLKIFSTDTSLFQTNRGMNFF